MLPHFKQEEKLSPVVEELISQEKEHLYSTSQKDSTEGKETYALSLHS